MTIWNKILVMQKKSNALTKVNVSRDDGKIDDVNDERFSLFKPKNWQTFDWNYTW